MNHTVVRGPRVRTAVATMILGGLLGIGGVVAIVVTVIDVFTSPSYQVPGTISVKLESGEHIIYELARQDYVTFDLGTTITPDDVDITGPDGESVPTYVHDGSERFDRDNASFRAAVGFDVDRDGRYRLDITAERPTRVLVQRSFDSVFASAALWFGLAGLGALFVVLGLTLLIVGIVRRSSSPAVPTAYGTPVAPQYGAGPTPPVTAPGSPTPQPGPEPPPVPTAPTLPPAGWHPDPLGQHRLRYWDGARWTDHTAE